VWLRIRTFGALLSARRSTRRNFQRAKSERILVVCYGNIYRSPFVALLLQQRLGPAVTVRSGGFHKVSGRSSPPRHVRSCERYGVSLAEHRSSVIKPEDLGWADLIVLMDRANCASLFRMGVRQDKLIWLGALVPGDVEVPDPFTLGDAAADEVVDRLHAATESFARVVGSAAKLDR
jgi:protein-tyrosine phosphatase